LPDAPKRRPYIVGLTGSIGMGKTETAKLFARVGVPVFDSDAVVRELYGAGGAAVEPLSRAFPGSARNGEIDRTLLSRELASDPAAFEHLESIVHPLVRKAREEFIVVATQRGEPVVVLDIPLLFETGAEASVDAVVVVSAPAELQEKRVLARPEMTREKLTMLQARQLPDNQKRAKADFVIETDKGLAQAFCEVRRVAGKLLQLARKRQSDA
jgi:dephospho-CoA kinase